MNLVIRGIDGKIEQGDRCFIFAINFYRAAIKVTAKAVHALREAGYPHLPG